MIPRYRVTLTTEERVELSVLTRTGKTNARRFVNARALLLCDAPPDGPGWTVANAAEALGVTSRTIEHLTDISTKGDGGVEWADGPRSGVLASRNTQVSVI